MNWQQNTNVAGPLRVLLVHANYQLRGGEDVVVEAERELLRSHGHEVIEYRRHNDEVGSMSRFRAVADSLWSGSTAKAIAKLIAHSRPDVMHVHNTFPVISPSIYWAAHDAGVPVVQTLHNFRLLCPQATFLREGRVCEDCLGRVPAPAIAHGCYRESRLLSAGVVAMLSLHRSLGTWRNKVDRYIALNEFCRRKFIEGGLPADRIVVKPNFIDLAPVAGHERSGFLYVGRLSIEKGIEVLANAATQVSGPAIRVVGAGPSASQVANIPGIECVGALAQAAVYEQMRRATALVLPSICYESFPRTLVEAFACGLPVIASRLGALAELIEDGVTGLLFSPGDASALASKIKWAHENPDQLAEMGRQARARYDAHYTAQENYDQLIQIYESVIGWRSHSDNPLVSSLETRALP